MAGVLAALVALWWSLRLQKPTPSSGVQTSVALLTFEYSGQDRAQQYLCWAVPDEIALGLGRETNLAVRPFSNTRNYPAEKLDYVRAARDLHATYFITGRVTRVGANLQFEITLIDPDTRKVKLRQEFTTSVESNIEVRAELAKTVLPNLAAALGMPLNSVAMTMVAPNEQAYDLYLRSVAMPYSGGLNREAIAMLQRSTELDPTLAAAWLALGDRLRDDALQGDAYSADAKLAQAATALARALSLDGRFAAALEAQVKLSVDRNHLNDAYDLAQRLIALRPGSSYAHLLRADVLRHGGMLREAASDCDTALHLDPREFRLRSCSVVYEMLGQRVQAERFTHVDLGTGYSSWRHVFIALDEGNREAALTRLDKVRSSCEATLLTAYLKKAPAETLTKLTAACEADSQRPLTADEHLLRARVFGYTQQPEASLLEVQRAQQRGDCASPMLASDPLLKSVRELPGFEARRRQSDACAAAFRQHVFASAR